MPDDVVLPVDETVAAVAAPEDGAVAEEGGKKKKVVKVKGQVAVASPFVKNPLVLCGSNRAPWTYSDPNAAFVLDRGSIRGMNRYHSHFTA